VKSVINMLKQTLDDRGVRRAAARAEWFAGAGKPLDTQYVLDHWAARAADQAAALPIAPVAGGDHLMAEFLSLPPKASL
jgi:hypothetical protein